MSNPVELDPREYVKTLEHLKKIDFLASVPDDDLRSVLMSLQKQSFAADKTILFQGEIANRLCIIVRGSVSIISKMKGQKVVLAQLTPPAYFGEISLLRPMAATATVTAGDQGADLIILTQEALADLSKRLPAVSAQIQSVIESRLASRQKAADAEENG